MLKNDESTYDFIVEVSGQLGEDVDWVCHVVGVHYGRLVHLGLVYGKENAKDITEYFRSFNVLNKHWTRDTNFKASNGNLV